MAKLAKPADVVEWARGSAAGQPESRRGGATPAVMPVPGCQTLRPWGTLVTTHGGWSGGASDLLPHLGPLTRGAPMSNYRGVARRVTLLLRARRAISGRGGGGLDLIGRTLKSWVLCRPRRGGPQGVLKYRFAVDRTHLVWP